MKMTTVGITYDLKDDYRLMGYTEEEIAEFDSKDTIDAIEITLQSLGYKAIRIGNIHNLTNYLASGNRCDIVFNICEGMNGTAREAQVPCLLDAYRIPYVFSGPDILALTLDKALTKMVIMEAGIHTAPFRLLKQTDQIKDPGLPYPLFVKPIGEGTSKGIDGYSLIHNFPELKKSCTYLITNFHQPVLIETFLPGREFTVGMLGSGKSARTLGVMEIVFNNNCQHRIYSYSVKKEYEKYVSYQLADDTSSRECADMAKKIWELLDGKDAGRIDFKLDTAGKPSFVEVNPLAGLNPVYSDLPILCKLTGFEYRELIREIMDSAIARATITQQNVASTLAI